MRGWFRSGFSGPAIRAGAAGAMLALAALALPAPAAWTIVGTTVQTDGASPLPDVKVTVYPDSISGVTDENGDFIISWSGARGWLTLVPKQQTPEGKEWCKRYTLYPKQSTQADSSLDIGPIRIYPQARIVDPVKPLPPMGRDMLPRLRLPGPKEGEKPEYWQMMKFYTDLWGHVTRVEDIGGSSDPQRIHDALRDNILKMPWRVQPETRCGEDEPFWNVLTFSYAWQDSVWAPVMNWGPPKDRTGPKRRLPGAVPLPSK